MISNFEMTYFRLTIMNKKHKYNTHYTAPKKFAVFEREMKVMQFEFLCGDLSGETRPDLCWKVITLRRVLTPNAKAVKVGCMT